MSRRLVVGGDPLLDRDVEGVVPRLCPDSPVPVLDEQVSLDRPGGAGLAALFKEMHPGWSPMAIKSALMTTGTDVSSSALRSVARHLASAGDDLGRRVELLDGPVHRLEGLPMD